MGDINLKKAIKIIGDAETAINKLGYTVHTSNDNSIGLFDRSTKNPLHWLGIPNEDLDVLEETEDLEECPRCGFKTTSETVIGSEEEKIVMHLCKGGFCKYNFCVKISN